MSPLSLVPVIILFLHVRFNDYVTLDQVTLDFPMSHHNIVSMITFGSFWFKSVTLLTNIAMLIVPQAFVKIKSIIYNVVTVKIDFKS